MTFDMNDAQPQMSGELIPDGSFAKVNMTLRRGGADGDSDDEDPEYSDAAHLGNRLI